MASIFVSYSSRDERAAVGLQAWLREHNIRAVLMPRSKKQEQGDFEAQKQQIISEIKKTDLVLFLVTPFWQVSALCQWEKQEALAGGKPLIALLEAPSSTDMPRDVVIIDMTKNREAGLVELRAELTRIGINGEKKAASKVSIVKNLSAGDQPEEVELQGTVIANHNRKKLLDGKPANTPQRRAERHEASVNHTLKILRQGIRWSAFPDWLAKVLKLPVAGTRINDKIPSLSVVKKLKSKIPSFKSLASGAAAWVFADKIRIAGAAFLLFVFATALIGMISDRTIGGKDAIRKELANVKKRQSLFLSRVANHLRETGDEETAVLLALEAVDEAQERDDAQKARDSLYASWIQIQKSLLIKGHDNHVSGAMFSPDGKFILSSSWDRTARVWSVSSQKQVLVLKGHDGFVNGAVYSPDQSLILTAALDNKARLFNARTGVLIRTLKGHSNDLASAVFSRDGRRIVTASGDQTARVWDVAGGKPVTTLLGAKAGLEYASFSPDGNRVVTASADKKVRIIDVASGKQLALLEGHEDVVRSARFDPKGELIATASQDKTIRLWGARTGVLQKILKGHEWAVLSASFSLDGQRLVTGSKDNTARIWDVKTGEPILVLKGHKGIVSQASFSPDGRMIVTASGDGTIRLWPLIETDRELVEKARRTVSKCLTLAQRKKYFLSETPPKWCVKMKKYPFNK